MINYDKSEIKEQLELEDIFQLLVEFGGEPEYTNFGIISSTICHNLPGEGSRKLYYYINSGLFQCWTGCQGYFDVFELVRKVSEIQWQESYDLNDAVRWIARRFGISGTSIDEKVEDALEDWKIFANYERIQEISPKEDNKIVLKEYNSTILDRLNYNIRIKPWLDEDITQEVLDCARIGFYPGGDQITIPHYDENSRFIGLRGRAVCQEDIDLYGKYRPIKISGQMYNHPLGMNLYGYNWNKNNIKLIEKAIVFESEKSVLKYASYFGWDNNISVACCGSSLSAYQIKLLIEAGAKEIIIAFDRQFKELGDKEFNHLTKSLKKIHKKYCNKVNISFIFDKNMITNYKASPIDEGKDKFLKLFKERIFL